MNLFDQHCHCRISPDSRAPMADMIAASAERGLSLVCFTDHMDMDEYETGKFSPLWPGNWPLFLEEWASCEGYAPHGIQVRRGMELAEIHHAPEVAAEAASQPELDFVLGSLHNLRDTMDFYFIPYATEAECAQWNRKYVAELRELAEQPCFDVMAHVGYTSRYMHRRGLRGDVTVEDFREELSDIFRVLIQSGRGIEVNVSGLREGHTTYPTAPVLALYRSLGGEIITVGSDAHTPADAGVGVREGFELLKTLGFRYVAQYKKRKPEFIRLE